MHFLFISSIIGPTIGGIETLIGRMSNWLLENGHKVTLLANTAKEYSELFPKNMQVCEIGGRLRQLGFYHKAEKVWPLLEIDRPDVIKSFHLEDAWISSILSSLIRPVPKVLYGNYFPHVFPIGRNPFSHFTNKPYLWNLKCNYNDNSILCMDREQIHRFRRLYGEHRNPIFWPIPIENPNKHDIARLPKWGKIVSIGRLEPMKEYNLFMIDAIARLRQKGYPIMWIVYGEGCFADAMKKRINSLGLNEAIELKGKLAYSNIAAALQDAYLFVGGGTSIVEAAMCGVPGVMPLAFDATGATYGSLYQFPFGNLGLHTDKIPGTNIEVEIERILNLEEHDYQTEVRKNREYAKLYSMDIVMERFMGIVAKAASPRISFELFYYYYLHKMIEMVWLKAKHSTIRLLGHNVY